MPSFWSSLEKSIEKSRASVSRFPRWSPLSGATWAGSISSMIKLIKRWWKYLTAKLTGTFNENMSAGRGFIALAAVIFGRWNPFGAFGACLLFGFASALSIPLQREADISANLLSTLPYVLTLVALVGVIGRSVGPAAVGRPYTKG